jgi:hypothetical protein
MTNAGTHGCLDDAPFPIGLLSALGSDEEHAVNTSQRRRDRLGPVEVTHDHLDPLAEPRARLCRITYKGAWLLARRGKLPDDLAADRARRSRHQDQATDSRSAKTRPIVLFHNGFRPIGDQT